MHANLTVTKIEYQDNSARSDLALQVAESEWRKRNQNLPRTGSLQLIIFEFVPARISPQSIYGVELANDGSNVAPINGKPRVANFASSVC